MDVHDGSKFLENALTADMWAEFSILTRLPRVCMCEEMPWQRHKVTTFMNWVDDPFLCAERYRKHISRARKLANIL